MSPFILVCVPQVLFICILVFVMMLTALLPTAKARTQQFSILVSSVRVRLSNIFGLLRSLVRHKPSLAERTHRSADAGSGMLAMLGLSAVMSAAGVQYLLPGWSRDKDLDRERA